MREIKFRLWDKETNKYRNIDGNHDTFFISSNGSISYYNLQNGSGGDEYVIEQFTGQSDQNDKEIYENDIVNMDLGTCVITGKIEFANSSAFMLSTDSDLYEIDNFVSLKVIGNIHENPELLEQK